MTEPWYEGLPQSEEDRIYEQSVKRIKSAVEQGMSFDQAVSLIEVEKADLRELVVKDALKVLIAEMHFNAGKPLEEVSKKLKVPMSVLEKAHEEMLEEVAEDAVEQFRREGGDFGLS